MRSECGLHVPLARAARFLLGVRCTCKAGTAFGHHLSETDPAFSASQGEVAPHKPSLEIVSLRHTPSRSLQAYACSRRSVCGAILGGGSLLLGARPGVSASETRHAAKSVIVLLLEGGISQFESWDPKPEGPPEIRGPFGTIPTTNPDLRIGEHLPRLARQARLYSVIRTMQNAGSGNHDHALHRLLTGYDHPTIQAPQDVLRNHFPPQGSVVARQRGAVARGLPPFVAIPDLTQLGKTRRLLGPGYLGSAYEAFQAGSIPLSHTSPYALPAGLVPVAGLTRHRITERRRLLKGFDRLRGSVEQLGPTLTPYEHSAFQLLLGSAARTAFDLNAESPATRESYGDSAMGQSMLLGRRLVEAGVPYVLVNCGDGANLWDTHADNFKLLKDKLLPPFDCAASALLQDLEARGLLEETLVVFLSEFGRTPQINKDAGRDHHTDAYSVVLAGGGIKPGRVLGQTTAGGEEPAERPVANNELLATIYHQLGIDYEAMLLDTENRPIPILPPGVKPLHELL